MADDYLAVLAREFVADEGTFLLQLRCDMTWDKVAFTRLTEAMLACCQAYDAAEKRAQGIGFNRDETCLPRWLAEGFWWCSTFIREWTTHPAWVKRTRLEQEYFDKAYERLHDLAFWFFTGMSPYTNDGPGFAPM